jgi:hypothetical protein
MRPEGVEERVVSLLPQPELEGCTRADIDIVVIKRPSLGRTHEAALARFRSSVLPGRMDEIAAESGIGGRPSEGRLYQQNLIGTPDEIAEQLDGVRRAPELLEQLQWFGEKVAPRVR